MRLILASESPQRRELLTRLGIPFDVVPSSIDERTCAVNDPADRARCLAALKARGISRMHPESVVIGCDTLVVAQDGTLLEKPEHADDARRMLRLQSGKQSLVHSGITVIHPEHGERTELSTSTVHFKELTANEIDQWIATNLWKGKSGAFQVDGEGRMLIERIDGDRESVIGLPVKLLKEMLREMGVHV